MRAWQNVNSKIATVLLVVVLRAALRLNHEYNTLDERCNKYLLLPDINQLYLRAWSYIMFLFS